MVMAQLQESKNTSEAQPEPVEEVDGLRFMWSLSGRAIEASE
jgi:hypothetical protein